MKITSATLAAALPLLLSSLPTGIDGAPTATNNNGHAALLRLAGTAKDKRNALLQKLPRRNNILLGSSILGTRSGGIFGTRSNGRIIHPVTRAVEDDEEKCGIAVLHLNDLEAACPKQCHKGLGGSFGDILGDLEDLFGGGENTTTTTPTAEGELATCDEGESERTPTTCGTTSPNTGTECMAALSKINDQAYDEIMMGLQSCLRVENNGAWEDTSVPDDVPEDVLGDYARFADDESGTLLALYLQHVAGQCGYGPTDDGGSVIAFTYGPEFGVGSCEEGIAFMERVDVDCPQACTMEGEDQGGLESLPVCAEGEGDRTPESCGMGGSANDSCSAYFTEVATPEGIAEARVGLSRCVVESDDFGEIFTGIFLGSTPGLLELLLAGIATSCGQSFEGGGDASCSGAIAFLSEIDASCPKKCSSDGGGQEDLPACGLNEADRDASSCGPQAVGADKCEEFISSIDDAKVEDVAAGSLQCGFLGEGEDGTGMGADVDPIEQAKTAVESFLFGIATQCDLTDAIGIEPGACASLTASFGLLITEVEASCPTKCSLDLNANAPCAEEDAFTRDPSTCGPDAPAAEECAAILASFDENKIEELAAAFVECQDDTEDPEGTPSPEAQIALFVLGIAAECGQTDAIQVGDGGCINALEMMVGGGFDLHCPIQCQNYDDEYSTLPACGPNQKERGPDSCGNDMCSTFLGKIDATTLACGILSCANGPFAGITELFLGEEFEDMSDAAVAMGAAASFEYFALETAADCGFDNAMPPPEPGSCGAAIAYTSQFEVNCPRQCAEDPDDNGDLRMCEDDETEHSPESCGTVCEDFLTNVKLEDIHVHRCGLGMCGPGGGEGLAFAEIKEMLTTAAMQCGFPGAFALEDDGTVCPAPPALVCDGVEGGVGGGSDTNEEPSDVQTGGSDKEGDMDSVAVEPTTSPTSAPSSAPSKAPSASPTQDTSSVTRSMCSSIAIFAIALVGLELALS